MRSVQHQKLIAFDLGYMPLLPFGVLVGTGNQFSLDHDPFTLDQVIFHNIGGLAPGHDVVPFGVRYLFALRVLVVLIGG